MNKSPLFALVEFYNSTNGLFYKSCIKGNLACFVLHSVVTSFYNPFVWGIYSKICLLIGRAGVSTIFSINTITINVKLKSDRAYIKFRVQI